MLKLSKMSIWCFILSLPLLSEDTWQKYMLQFGVMSKQQQQKNLINEIHMIQNAAYVCGAESICRIITSFHLPAAHLLTSPSNPPVPSYPAAANHHPTPKPLQTLTHPSAMKNKYAGMNSLFCIWLKSKAFKIKAPLSCPNWDSI